MRSPGAQQTAGLPRPGSTSLRGPNGEMVIPDDRRINTAALSQMGNAPVGIIHGGLSFQGSGADAARFFSAPVLNATQRANLRNVYTSGGPEVLQAEAAQPSTSSHLIPLPSYINTEGMGWKSRRAAQQTNAAMYGDYLRAITGMRNTDVTEAGANYRTNLGLDATARKQQESPSEVALRQAQATNQLAQAQAAGQPKYSYGEEEVRYGFPGLDGTYQTKKVPIRRSATGEVDRTQVEEVMKDNALRSQFIAEMLRQKGADDLWAKASAEMKEAAYQQWLKSKQQGGA